MLQSKQNSLFLSILPRAKVLTVAQARGRGVLNKVLYGEGPPRGPTPYPFLIEKVGAPFTYIQFRTLHPFKLL